MDPTRTALRVSARLYQRVGAQLILVVAFVGMLACMLFFFVNSSFAVRIFEATVNAELRGRIGWGRLNWGPLPWQLRILEPVLLDPDGQPVITARAVHVGAIDFPALLAGRIAASDIRVEGAVVRLVSRVHPTELDDFGRPDEVINISELFWPPGARYDDGAVGGAELSFTDVEVRDTVFELDLPDFWMRVAGIDLRGARFAVGPDGDESMRIGAVQLSADAGRVRVRTGETPRRARRAPSNAVLAWPIRDLRISHFDWAGQSFDVAAVRTVVRGDTLELKRLEMDLDRPGVPYLAGRVELGSDDISRHLRPLGLDAVSGAAHVTVIAAGEVDAIEAKVDLDGTDLDIFGRRIDSLDMQLELDPDLRVDIPRVFARGLGGQIDLSGWIDLAGGDAYADVVLTGIDTAATLPPVDPAVADVVEGALDLRTRLRMRDLFSSARRLAADLDLRLDRAGPPVHGLGQSVEAEAFLLYERQALRIFGLEVDTQGDSVTLAGRVGLDEPSASLSGRIVVDELAPYTRALKLPLTGAVDARFGLEGPLESPRVRADLRARRLRYDNLPEASVDGRLVYARGRLELGRTQVKTGVGEASVRGSIGVGRRGVPLDLHVDARRVDLGALPVDAEIDGRLDATVHMTGRAARPSVSGRLRVRNPRWRQLQFARLDVEGALEGDAVRLKQLRLDDRDGPRLMASGQANLRTESFSGSVEVIEVPLDLVNRLVEEPLPLRGRLSATVAASGRFDDPQGVGDLRVKGFGYDQWDLGEGALELMANGEAITLEGRLFDQFDVNATIPPRPGTPAELSVEFADLDVGDYVPALTENRARVRTTGRVNARLDLFGEALIDEVKVQLDALAAEYTLVDERGRPIPPPSDPECKSCPTLTVKAGEPVELRFDGEALRVERLELVGEGQALNIDGRVDTRGTLDLMARGDLQLAALSPFLAGAFSRVTGSARIDLRVSGAASDPRPEGRVALMDAQLDPRSATVGRELTVLAPVELLVEPAYGPQLPTQADDRAPIGVFTVSLPAERTRLSGAPGEPNRFRVRRDDAELRVEDFVAHFVDFVPDSMSAQFRANEVTINVPRTLRMTVDLDPVRFEMWTHRAPRRRPETRLRLAGDVEILYGEYTADHTSAADINRGLRDDLSGTARTRSVDVFEASPILKRLMLDLRVRNSNDVFVRSQIFVLNLELEIRSDLRVKGFLHHEPTDDPDDALAIEGRVEVLEDSRINYARRPFDVLNGSVVFGSGDFLNAVVEATHTFRIRTQQAGLTASQFDRGGAGEFREEEVTLEVSVRVPTADSDAEFELGLRSNSGLSNIEVATLVLTGQLPSELSGLSSAQPATEVLLGPVLGLVERQFSDTLDLDLSLTSASTGTLVIDADKLLSRRLRLYSRTPVGENDVNSPQTFGLEYRINNEAFGELTNESYGGLNSTSARLRLRWWLD